MTEDRDPDQDAFVMQTSVRHVSTAAYQNSSMVNISYRRVVWDPD